MASCCLISACRKLYQEVARSRIAGVQLTGTIGRRAGRHDDRDRGRVAHPRGIGAALEAATEDLGAVGKPAQGTAVHQDWALDALPDRRRDCLGEPPSY